MSFAFQRSIGAPADVAELEYCSALRQTEKDYLRRDATLTARDLQYHLVSRHGVQVDLDVIEQWIMVELAGCKPVWQQQQQQQQEEEQQRLDAVENPLLDGEDPPSLREDDDQNEVIADLHEEINVAAEHDDDNNDDDDDILFLDLVQQTALLLIPELQRIRQRSAATAVTTANRIGQQSDNTADMMGLIQITLHKILQQSGLKAGVVLTKEVLKDILEVFGEEWTEELVEEMLQDCCSDNDDDERSYGSRSHVVVLNEETLLRAMTCDTTLYQTDWENRATPHYQDALMSSSQKKVVTRTKRSSMIQPGMIAIMDQQDNDLLKRIYTAPSIDTTVDSLRSFTWSILSWLVLVVLFFAYFLDGFTVHKTLPTLNCDDTVLSSFGCRYFTSFLTWLEVFIELTTLGVAFVYLTTLGNSSFPFAYKWRATMAISIGMLTIIFSSILSYAYRVDVPFVNTDKQEGKRFVYRTSIVLGTLLLAVQLGQVIRLLLPIPEKARHLFETGGLKMERWTKKASAYKVQKMLLHALACHAGDEVPMIEGEDLFKSISHHSLKLINTLPGIPEERNTFNAMLVYMKHAEQTERVGGSIWVWKSILFRRSQIFGREGIWLFPRLIATNLIQLFVLICIPIFFVFAAKKVRNDPDWFADLEIEVYE